MRVNPFSTFVDLGKLVKIAFTPVGYSEKKLFRDTFTRASLPEVKGGIHRKMTSRNLREIKRRVISHDFRP